MRALVHFNRPSKPDINMLMEHGPQVAWETVIAEAERSPMSGYQTGAVIMDPDGEVIFKGCSHPSLSSKMNSVHAERHCLGQARHSDLRGSVCFIYTRSPRSGGAAWTSRPCLNCARALVKRGISRAIYPVRDQETGLWRVDVDYMNDVMDPVLPNKSFFARNLVR